MANWQPGPAHQPVRPQPHQVVRGQPTFAQAPIGDAQAHQPLPNQLLPSQPAPGPVEPFTGDSQILAADRARSESRRKKGLAIYVGLLAGLFALISIPTFFVSPVFGIVMLMIMAGALGLGLGLAVLIGKSQGTVGGPASKGPLAFGQVHTRMPADQVWATLRQVAQANSLTWRQVGPTTALLENSMNWISWGNRFLVDLRPSIDQPGAGVVTVQAEPKMPATLHDYGRNQAVVNSLLFAVPGRALPPSGPQDRFTSQ